MTGEVVLVTGPRRAGVTAMVEELRRRMPSCRFVDGDNADLTRADPNGADPNRADPNGAADPPAVVVFVMSAVAPIVESDCALADLATAQTAAVIAVVSKIDDHHPWRRVLAANRQRLGEHAARFGDVPWVGAAAAPRLGAPRMDDLVALLAARLGDPTLAARNTLCRINFQIDRHRRERELLLQRRRRAQANRLAARRTAVREARLALAHGARRRCAELRTELLDEAATAVRAQLPGFGARARQRCAEVLADVDGDVSVRTQELAPGCGAAPEPEFTAADPLLTARRLESQLMAVLGGGFGLGVAVVVTRLLAGVAPQLAIGAVVAGGAVGALTTAWVTRARTLLQARAVLQAWVADTVAAVRASADERVAAAMLLAETEMMSAAAAETAIEEAEFGHSIAAVDAQIGALRSALGRGSENRNLLPVGRPPGYGHLNRSCE